VGTGVRVGRGPDRSWHWVEAGVGVENGVGAVVGAGVGAGCGLGVDA
jgi:hypothetical protein